MSVCELTETCLFFNDKMANMPATATTYKKIFCEEDNAKCARYMVYKVKGRPAVPQDLFPNETARAQAVIAA